MPDYRTLLDQYKTDTAAAMKEIERAKQVYLQKQKTGDKAGAEAAHKWAEQVRQASGISNNDSVYGNNTKTYTGGRNGYSSDYTSPPPVLAPSMPGGGGDSATILQSLMQMLGGGLPSQATDQFRNQAAQQAAQQAKQQRDALGFMMQQYQNQRAGDLSNWQYGMRNMAAQQQQAAMAQQYNMGMLQQQQAAQMAAIQQAMKQAGTTRDSSMQTVKDRLTDASVALEDQSFRDSLSARQEMANRGLSGSGLAQDQDTRLLLAKQQNMAGLQRDAARSEADIAAAYTNAQDQTNTQQQQAMSQYGLNLSKLFSDAAASNAQYANNMFKGQSDLMNLNSRYNTMFNQVNSQLSQINEAKLQDELYNKMLENAQSGQLDRAKALTDIFGKLLPYDRASMDQLLGTQYNYDKMNNDSYNNYWDRMQRADNANSQNLIEWSKLGGVLPNGQPTLDAQKLMETARNNQVLENLRAQGLISEDQYRQGMLANQQNAYNLNVAKYQQGVNNDNTKIIIDAMNATDRELTQLSQTLKDAPPEMRQQIQFRMNRLTSYKQQMLEQLLGSPSSAPPLGYDSNGYPVSGPPNPNQIPKW